MSFILVFIPDYVSFSAFLSILSKNICFKRSKLKNQEDPDYSRHVATGGGVGPTLRTDAKETRGSDWSQEYSFFPPSPEGNL